MVKLLPPCCVALRGPRRTELPSATGQATATNRLPPTAAFHQHQPTNQPNPTGVGLLMLNYAGAIYLGLACPLDFKAPIMVGAHAVLAAILGLRTVKLAKEGYTRGAVQSFYQWIWNLFYAEYLLLPFV